MRYTGVLRMNRLVFIANKFRIPWPFKCLWITYFTFIYHRHYFKKTIPLHQDSETIPLYKDTPRDEHCTFMPSCIFIQENELRGAVAALKSMYIDLIRRNTAPPRKSAGWTDRIFNPRVPRSCYCSPICECASRNELCMQNDLPSWLLSVF